MSRLSQYLNAIEETDLIPRVGRVKQFNGLVVESEGPDVFIGELCEIYPPGKRNAVQAEVVGFRGDNVLLIPYGNLQGIYFGSEIVATGRMASIRVGDELRGRVIDAFGKPLDGKPLPLSGHIVPLYKEPVNPLLRDPVEERVETGISVIDNFLPMARGQRLGIFAGSGVGKSSVLSMLARHMKTSINVIALIGERGREVTEFINDSLGEEGLRRSVLVVASADQPALVRSHAAYTATAIAEYFCDQGEDVTLLMDSVTRFAMAQREVGLSIGEPPTSRGYTPSVFSALPRLAERAGNFTGKGSITAFFTVLVEGDDFNEPISDHMRAILDGHMVLTREQANRGVYPACDLLKSASRLIGKLFEDDDRRAVQKSLEYLAEYNEAKDLIDLGAYKQGVNPDLDAAIRFVPELTRLISQPVAEARTGSQSMQQLKSLLKGV